MRRPLLLAAAIMFSAAASAQQPAVSGIVPAPAPTVAAIAAIPAATAPEVAAIVAREFPAYDKDADGALSPAEFGDWMVRLKAIADPRVTADAPSTKTWLGAAFAQADADKSRTITQGELNGFLSQGRS